MKNHAMQSLQEKIGVRFETAKRVRQSLEEEISGFKKQCFLAACKRYRMLGASIVASEFSTFTTGSCRLLLGVGCGSLASFSSV